MVATRVSTTNGIPQPTLATALPTSAMPSHTVRPMQARIPAHQAASPMCPNAPVRTVTPDAIVTHWSAEGNCGVIEGGQAHGPRLQGGRPDALLFESGRRRAYRRLGAQGLSGAAS